MATFDITVTQDNIGVADSVEKILDQERVIGDSVAVSDSVSAASVSTLEISNARALTNTKIRIDFNVPTIQNAALTNPASYSIAAVSPGAIGVVPQSVELPPGQTNPLFVEVVVTEHTDGAIYAVTLAGALEGTGGEPAGSGVANYAGLGDAPNVNLVLATGKNQARVFFSETMEDNAAIRDVTNYVWDNGLVTAAIEDVTLNVVTLRTTDQVPDLLYNLTVRGILSVVIKDKITIADVITEPAPPGVNVVVQDGVTVVQDGVTVVQTL